MKEAQDLHNRAMQAAQQADAARRAQDETLAQHLFFDAFRWERDAARSVSPTLEPTRSILCRSAAALALDCALPAEALQLIKLARQGAPPVPIASELDDLERRSEVLLGTLHRHAS